MDYLCQPHASPYWSEAWGHALLEDARANFARAPAATALKPDVTPHLLKLISVGGLQNQDLPMLGSLRVSAYLDQSPHIQQLLSRFYAKLGRVCLIAAHTPVDRPLLFQNTTFPLFYQTVQIPLGCLVPGDDTAQPWHIFLQIEQQHVAEYDAQPALQTLDIKLFDPTDLLTFKTQTALPARDLTLAEPQLQVLSSVQMQHYIKVILQHIPPEATPAQQQPLQAAATQFLADWQQAYAKFANDYAGEWAYTAALQYFRAQLMPLAQRLCAPATHAPVKQALAMIASQLTFFPTAPRRVNRAVLNKARQRKTLAVTDDNELPRLDRPIFIVSAPRSGSTLLFETLSQFPELWSTGEENHELVENIPGLHPQDNGFASNCLTAAQATTENRLAILRAFTSKLQNRQQQYYLDLPPDTRPRTLRFLEKTPKNALRIPYFKALFPDALFIYLQRDFKDNVSSLIDGWRSQRFIAYKNLPDLARHWSFLLIPGWQQLCDASIAEIATQQWRVSNQIIQNDLANLPAQDWLSVDYQDLITQPATVVRAIQDFAGLAWDDKIQARCQDRLPVSRLALTVPEPNKWLKHQHVFAAC